MKALLLLAALTAHKPQHDWAWAYRQLNGQSSGHELPSWCAVTTGGFDKREGMLLGYCRVRAL